MRRYNNHAAEAVGVMDGSSSARRRAAMYVATGVARHQRWVRRRGLPRDCARREAARRHTGSWLPGAHFVATGVGAPLGCAGTAPLPPAGNLDPARPPPPPLRLPRTLYCCQTATLQYSHCNSHSHCPRVRGAIYFGAQPRPLRECRPDPGSRAQSTAVSEAAGIAVSSVGGGAEP